MTTTSSLRPGLLAFLFLLFVAVPLRADHLIGGEFTYVCRGFLNDDPATNIKVYDITLTMYRNCLPGRRAYFDGLGRGRERAPDGSTSAPAHVTIYRGNTLFVPTLSILLGSVTEVPLSAGNPCFEIIDPICQEVGIYNFTVELPVSDETYSISYQRCCRNPTIQNIVEPRGQGSTYSIQIPAEAQRRCNASPVFNATSPIAICINTPFSIDLGATEPDGDSLVYVFCDAVTGGTRDNPVVEIESAPPYQRIPWRSPLYSVNEQFGPGSTLALNPETGLLTGIPITRGKFTVAMCVEEWTRGPGSVRLSETKRDFELNIILCEDRVMAELPGNAPSVNGNAVFVQCGPGAVEIPNTSTDPDFISSYTWVLEGPNGPISGSQRDFRTVINETGTYPGIMLLNREATVEGCRDTARFELTIFPAAAADFAFEQPGCDDEPVTFTDLTDPPGDNEVVAWSWDFADGSEPSERQNPQYLYRIPGNFRVSLLTTDDNGCTAVATKEVTYFPSPRTLLVEPSEGFGCAPFTKPFVNLSSPVNDDYIYEWEFGDGGTDTVNSPVHEYTEVGIYDVYLGVTSPTGCFTDTVFSRLIDVRELPTAAFTWTPEVPSNLDPLVTIENQSTDARSFRYQLFSPGGELLRNEPFDFTYETRDSAVLVRQIVVHPSGCRDTLTQRISQRFENTFYMPDAFTPNGDGLNDVLAPVGILQRTAGYRLEVWSRYGQMVFATENPQQGWDGTYNGKPLPGGIYLWNADFINAEGEMQQFKGGVSLFR